MFLPQFHRDERSSRHGPVCIAQATRRRHERYCCTSWCAGNLSIARPIDREEPRMKNCRMRPCCSHLPVSSPVSASRIARARSTTKASSPSSLSIPRCCASAPTPQPAVLERQGRGFREQDRRTVRREAAEEARLHVLPQHRLRADDARSASLRRDHGFPKHDVRKAPILLRTAYTLVSKQGSGLEEVTTLEDSAEGQHIGIVAGHRRDQHGDRRPDGKRKPYRDDRHAL